MNIRPCILGRGVGILAGAALAGQAGWAQTLRPAFSTVAVPGAPGDPAIWVNRRAPARSLVLGTSNGPAEEGGGLYVFDMQGQRRQTIKLDHPSGVDVEYGVRLGGEPIDIAVVTERGKKQLRLYRIAGTGELIDIAPLGISVFAGEADNAREPSGVAIYKRPRDGAAYAFVTRTNSPTVNALWQYRLLGDGKGNVFLQRIRTLGTFSGLQAIGPLAVDDSAGFVYYVDRGYGIHKYYADPLRREGSREAGFFGRNLKGTLNGMAPYAAGGVNGAVLCTEQVSANTRFHLFRRDGNQRSERATLTAPGTLPGVAATALSIGPRFNQGIVVASDLDRKVYNVYDARALAARR